MGNTIILHGRLTKDPEQRQYTKRDGSTGTMSTFCVACDAKFGDATYYYDCTAAGKTGELIYTHMKKGSEILLYGEHVYRDKDGKRFWNVNVDRFEFCGSRQNSGTPSGETFQEVSDSTPF